MSRRRLNWVDRLEPPEPEIARVLQRFLALDAERDAGAKAEYAHAIVQMVRANASEGEVANYLAYVQQQRGQPVTPPPMRRYVAIALWHIAKAALVRDAARLDELAPVDIWRRDRPEGDPSA
jgi:hypothetical protein